MSGGVVEAEGTVPEDTVLEGPGGLTVASDDVEEAVTELDAVVAELEAVEAAVLDAAVVEAVTVTLVPAPDVASEVLGSSPVF